LDGDASKIIKMQEEVQVTTGMATSGQSFNCGNKKFCNAIVSL